MRTACADTALLSHPAPVHPSYLIIADDLSGAADCAAGFARAGLASEVLLGADAPAPGVAVVTVDTDSRRDDAATASAKACAALARHGAGRRVIKKIDSTLRGGWAAEVAALQPTLGLALVAPAFPALRRTVRDGTVRVDGTPLADTATWRLEHDGRESRPLPMLQAAGLRCEPVDTGALSAGPASLQQRIAEAGTRGCQALVFDTEDTEQLAALARATHALPGVFWVASAGLAGELARCAIPARDGSPAPDTDPDPECLAVAGRGLLTVVGSLSPVAERQIARLREAPGTTVHIVAPGLLRADPGAEAGGADWAHAIRAELAQGRDPVACIGTDAALDPAEGPRLARHLALHLAAAMREAAGLVLTGGETARAMLGRTGIGRLRILGESEPGVVLSRSVADRPQYIATKAGAFGDAGSLEGARQALRQRLAAASS